MPELVLSGLSRRYGAVQALDSVSFAVRGGEVHALMGENGAGKSTLIRLLAGLERPDAGTMTLDGRPAAFDSPAASQKAGLRVLHQELQVVPALSVAENMHLHRAFPHRLGLVDWRALNRAARATLDRLGLSRIDPAAPMEQLAPGDRMLTRIAATLIGDGEHPWLYILDEPTAALSAAESERLFAVIAELTGQGAGVLYVSHRMPEVLRLAARVTVLRDGRHVSTLPMAETDEARIIAAMTGRAPGALFPPRPAAVPRAAPLLTAEGLAAGPLRSATFTLAPGEVLGLAGLAGAGRNALLRALMGAIPRQAGTLTLAGRPFAPRHPAEAWAAGLAYVPRERRAEGLMPARAVAETITLPHLSRLSGPFGWLRHARERTDVARSAEEVRLRAASLDQPVGALSGGNQQKALFARALLGAPRVLLLDEPTRGVDVGARADIYRLIRTRAEAGTGVILASSDLPELLGLADRIALLHAGRLVSILDPRGLTESALLAAIYDAGRP